MGSIHQPKADLSVISTRLHTIADALRRTPGDHAHLPNDIDDLREELLSIATKLRSVDRLDFPVGASTLAA